MQVDLIKPALKAPATKLLKLKYEKLLSSFAFNLNLRRYIMAVANEDGFHAYAEARNMTACTCSNVVECKGMSGAMSGGAEGGVEGGMQVIGPSPCPQPQAKQKKGR